jgi:hypothetical protein
MNPFLFIVGCPRSGTTLVRRIVDAHAEIAVTRETHWVVEWFRRCAQRTREGFVTPELLSGLLKERRFSRLVVDARELEDLLERDEPVSYARFVTAVFDLYGRSRGKPIVGDKTPKYVRHLPTLRALWPDVRIVHVVRDGRDVCLSANGWTRHLVSLERRFPTWRSDPVTTAALWWEWHARAGREDGTASRPELYYELRYESLVADVEAECANLCAFLGVPYDDAMVRFHEGRTKADPGLDAKHAWLPATPGLRDWRTQMPAADVVRFEAAAGKLLEELGYDRAVTRPPEEAVVRASRLSTSFAEHIHSLEPLAPHAEASSYSDLPRDPTAERWSTQTS